MGRALAMDVNYVDRGVIFDPAAVTSLGSGAILWPCGVQYCQNPGLYESRRVLGPRFRAFACQLFDQEHYGIQLLGSGLSLADFCHPKDGGLR